MNKKLHYPFIISTVIGIMMFPLITLGFTLVFSEMPIGFFIMYAMPALAVIYSIIILIIQFSSMTKSVKAQFRDAFFVLIACLPISWLLLRLLTNLFW